MFTPIANQPITFTPPVIDPCNEGFAIKNFPAKFQRNDKIWVQWKRTHCGNVLCNQNEEEPYAGEDLFTHDDNPDPLGWDLPAGINYVTDGLEKVSGGSPLTAVNYTKPLSQFKVYRVAFRISGYVSGNIRPFVLGTNDNYNYSADGNYVAYIYTAVDDPDDIAGFIMSNDFEGRVDNYFLHEMVIGSNLLPVPDFASDPYANGWAVSSGNTNHWPWNNVTERVWAGDSSGGATFQTEIPSLVPGQLYLFAVDIKDVIDGSVGLYVDLGGNLNNFSISGTGIIWLFMQAGSSDKYLRLSYNSAVTSLHYSIDDILLQEVQYAVNTSEACWVGLGWRLYGSNICPETQDDAELSLFNASLIQSNKDYTIRIQLTQRSTGILQLVNDGNVVELIVS